MAEKIIYILGKISISAHFFCCILEGNTLLKESATALNSVGCCFCEWVVFRKNGLLSKNVESDIDYNFYVKDSNVMKSKTYGYPEFSCVKFLLYLFSVL
jgi:hypothetical protein